MKPTCDEIIRVAGDLTDGDDWEYEYVGVRTQEVPFRMGPMDHVSVVWDDGDETDEELDGVSVTYVSDRNPDRASIRMHSRDHAPGSEYFGDHVALIGFDDYEDGYDDGEVVAEDPVVVHIFC